MANITVIPATKALHTQMPINTRSRRLVAGYARVSTDSEEQLTSMKHRWITTPASSAQSQIGSL